MSALAAMTPQAVDALRRAKVARLSPRAREALRRSRRHYAPRRRMTVAEWSEIHRYMHSGPLAGMRFSLDQTPVLRGILAAYMDPLVSEIWCQKSAQIGWTQGVVLNVMGYHVHLDPCQILVLFGKDGSGKRFMREKLEPAIRASRVLLERIPLHARNAANTQDFKGFLGGFIQLAGTKSAGNVKSTDARVVIVEEPDDTAKNVQGQGDSIAMGRERKKAYANSKMLVGGTPTVKDLSKMDAGMLRTDQRRFYVECPHCRHEQVLRWENVTWQRDALVHHPIYGTSQPETARYLCEGENCGALWTDAEKNEAIVSASHRPDYGWRATASFSGFAGFYLEELNSLFADSRMSALATKYLEAEHAEKLGDDTLMRSFRNNQLGRVYEIKSDAPEVEELAERGIDYPEWTAPAEALVATCFVDVQRGGAESGEPRLEYLVVGWGRGEESWRIARGVVLGNPLEQETWNKLDSDLARPIRSDGGGTLPISLMGVDSGDGMTQDAVYRYVRAKRAEGRDVIATKGSSKHGKQIFSPPRMEDHQHNDKASKYGLKLYMIGTHLAKDALSARIKLLGRGQARMHWPKSIGIEYFRQVTAEVKVPGRNGVEVWQKKANRANEMLDCEVGNLHLSRKLRLHHMPESYWVDLEARVRQPDLLHTPAQNAAAAVAVAPLSSATPAASAGMRPFTGFRR